MNKKLTQDERLMLKSKKIFYKFGNIKLQDGSICVFESDTLKVGQTVYLTDGSQDWFMLAAGNYMTDKNQPFTIDENGKAISVGTIQDIDKTTGPINQAFKKTTMSTEKKDTLFEKQIDVAFAREQSLGYQGSRADFGKKFAPTVTTNTEAMFERAAALRKLNAEKANANMTFTPTNGESNLTAEQRVDAALERAALGQPDFKKKASEKHSAINVETRTAEYNKFKSAYGESFNTTLEKYLSFSEDQVSQLKATIKAAAEAGLLTARNHFSAATGRKKSNLEQALEARGWVNYDNED